MDIKFTVKDNLVLGDGWARVVFMNAGETGTIVDCFVASASNSLYSVRNAKGDVKAVYRDDIVKVGGLEPMP